MPPLGKGGNAVHNVAAATNFQHMASESVGALFGDDYGGFRLVLRPGRPATRPPVAASRLEAVMAAATSVGALIVAFLIIVVPVVFVVFLVLLVRAGAAVGGSGRVVLVVKLFLSVPEVERRRSRGD